MLFLTITLLAAMPQAATATKPTEADPALRTKCRTQIETGSLVKRTRTCRTMAEWRKVDEEQRARADRAIDQGTISCGDCRRGG